MRLRGSEMKYKILCALALSLTILACGKKAADAIAETAADVLLPSEVTPVDGAVDTSATGVDVTLPSAITP